MTTEVPKETGCATGAENTVIMRYFSYFSVERMLRLCMMLRLKIRRQLLCSTVRQLKR